MTRRLIEVIAIRLLVGDMKRQTIGYCKEPEGNDALIRFSPEWLLCTERQQVDAVTPNIASNYASVLLTRSRLGVSIYVVKGIKASVFMYCVIWVYRWSIIFYQNLLTARSCGLVSVPVCSTRRRICANNS